MKTKTRAIQKKRPTENSYQEEPNLGFIKIDSFLKAMKNSFQNPLKITKKEKICN